MWWFVCQIFFLSYLTFGSLVWCTRGTFKIRNEALPCNIFDEIQAHPPCKVHSKVYKLSKQFPETLEFEMLPQWNTRISIFEDDIPSELDIGLYFLSPRMSDLNRGSKPEITSTVGHEQSYCLLLEYLDKHELLLKTQIDKVELLVFSSKYLPEGSRSKLHPYIPYTVPSFVDDN